MYIKQQSIDVYQHWYASSTMCKMSYSLYPGLLEDFFFAICHVEHLDAMFVINNKADLENKNTKYCTTFDVIANVCWVT